MEHVTASPSSANSSTSKACLTRRQSTSVATRRPCVLETHGHDKASKAHNPRRRPRSPRVSRRSGSSLLAQHTKVMRTPMRSHDLWNARRTTCPSRLRLLSRISLTETARLRAATSPLPPFLLQHLLTHFLHMPPRHPPLRPASCPRPHRPAVQRLIKKPPVTAGKTAKHISAWIWTSRAPFPIPRTQTQTRAVVRRRVPGRSLAALGRSRRRCLLHRRRT